jgi:hypothetical protein
MTVPPSTTTTGSLPRRDVLNSARYYSGNRWALLVLGSLALIAGLFFGGWAWLVAAGLAPIVLSALPCLVMCGLGLCLACRSGTTQSTPASLDAVNSTTSPTALGVGRIGQPTAGGSGCCHEQAAKVLPTQVKQLQPTEERRDSHA